MYKQRRQKQEAGNRCEILNSSNQSLCLNGEYCGFMEFSSRGVGSLNCSIKIGDRGVNTTGFKPGKVGETCNVNTFDNDGKPKPFPGKWIPTTVDKLSCQLN